MVHALEEAWRVLRPEGLLLDLRPAMVHRKVGVAGQDGPLEVGVMRERFDDDLAADRAVAGALRRGLFRRVHRSRVPCVRRMDTLDEFEAWLAEFVRLGKFSSHAWLAKKVERAVKNAGEHAAGIFVSAPLALDVLLKVSAEPR